MSSKNNSGNKRNFNRKAPKADHQAAQSSKQPANSSDELIMLRYGPRNNLTAFKEQLIVKAGKEFGSLSRIFETDAYQDPPTPDDPYDDPNWNTLNFRQQQFANKEYEIKIKARLELIIKRDQDKEKLFSLIMGALSTESRERVEADPDWDDINEEMDPLRLWRRIHATHAVGGDLSVPIVARIRAEDHFNNIKQGSEESLINYKRRFNDAVRAYSAAIGHEPDEEVQAYRYMQGLDRNRFAEFIVFIQNNAQRGIKTHPATLSEMHQAVMEFQVVTNNRKVIAAPIFKFHAQQESKNTKHNKGKHGNSKPNSPRSPPTPCRHCGGDH